MNKLKILLLIGACFLQCKGRAPFKTAHGSVNFIVYFPSRYRGLCVGALVSRVAVITAAVCVTNPKSAPQDKRSINVVVGTSYRHARRGIRVQVTKLLIPNMSKIDSGNRGYLMSKSVAIMLLKRKVPDALTEIPLRGIDLDWKGEETLAVQEECIIFGWHFFYKGDKIYPGDKFLLQRNLRAQFVDIGKKNLWCDALTIKFRKALTNLGFHGLIESASAICIKDPDRTAQPCHGMYGAPVICRGKLIGLMMAPDAQWANCTGFSNIIHRFGSEFLSAFMKCVSGLFETEEKIPWSIMKKSVYSEFKPDTYDYIPEFYDKVTSSSETEDD